MGRCRKHVSQGGARNLPSLAEGMKGLPPSLPMLAVKPQGQRNRNPQNDF